MGEDNKFVWSKPTIRPLQIVPRSRVYGEDSFFNGVATGFVLAGLFSSMLFHEFMYKDDPFYRGRS